MGKSKAQKLKAKLAQILNTEESKIDIFSVMLKQARPPITDVRFSAHGSPYYKPVRLNGMVLLHREEVRDNDQTFAKMLKHPKLSLCSYS